MNPWLDCNIQDEAYHLNLRAEITPEDYSASLTKRQKTAAFCHYETVQERVFVKGRQFDDN